MHIVPPPRPAYRFVRRDGTSFGPYASIDEAASVLNGRLVLLVGSTHDRVVQFMGTDGSREHRTVPDAELVLVGPEGPVDPVLVREAFSRLRAARRAAEAPHFIFRAGPVPGTGRGSRKPTLWGKEDWRERRDLAALDPDLPPRFRRPRWASDKGRDPYPDIEPPRRIERSWKAHRRTRWKD